MGHTLITGADGYLGRLLAERLLRDTDDRLTLTVRTADPARWAALRLLLDQRRVDVVPADLRDPDPFATVDPAGITTIVHTAAVTAFNVDRPTARAVNVEGTGRLAAFARGCPRLTRLLTLSTLFSAGRRTGTVAETEHDPAVGFVNHYEWSKWAAEHRLRTDAAGLPLTIARLATIVADDDTGTVGQHNAFHNTLKLFCYGLLSLMPGDPKTPLYLATGEFTGRGLAHLARPDVPAGIYHLAPAPGEVLPLGELVDLAFDAFERDPGFRRRRLLRPAFCDIDGFRDLVEGSRGFGASPMRQALDSVAPFAEQMFLAKDFDSSRLRASWPGVPATDPRRLVEATCTHLVRTRWGRGIRREAP
jgi:nucleoside-diphosphate-sugar epimerase